MAKISWDSIDVDFERGIDRGVLFTKDHAPVAWNGLISVREKSINGEFDTIYVDSTHVSTEYTGEDFSAVLTAFTYPDEFESCLGRREHRPGVVATNHPRDEFSLSYRTQRGRADSLIHLVYNCVVGTNDVSYESMGDSVTPVTFSWEIQTVPERLYRHRPSAHISLSENESQPEALAWLYDAIYGTDTTDPYLPSADEVLIQFMPGLRVIDHGDGTWTAIGPNHAIQMVSPTEFIIDSPAAEYLDSESYTLTGY